jgi:NAD(P)-dependent dehydrogenase (short-subunit alcohol dehydrogenase family)
MSYRRRSPIECVRDALGDDAVVVAPAPPGAIGDVEVVQTYAGDPHSKVTKRKFGRIVNISSVIGQTDSVGQANYAASKSGLFGLSQSLAQDLARKGIAVNCVAPGYIETEMLAAVPEEVLAKLLKGIPVGGSGRPARSPARCSFWSTTTPATSPEA